MTNESARDLKKKTEGGRVGHVDRVLLLFPYLLVAGVVAFNLIDLRAETTPVAYLNDGAMHSEMVRFATAQLRAGHLPITGWFPFLGEGSPHLLHYQSLGATVTGALGLAVGPNTAFVWVLYLTLSTWPVSVFWAVRTAGFDRYVASFAALVSPLLFSVTGIGYEQHTYLTTGFGLWTQLLAMWTLPLAWGYATEAVRSRRALFPAALFVVLTMALHFLTGYLAILGIITAFLTADNAIRDRLRRLAELAASVVVLSAWVVVPLVWFRTYASINEFLQQGPDVNSYGARVSLEWLFTGKLFDDGRAIVLTPLVVIGLLVLAVRARRSAPARNVLALFCASLLLFFGKTTLGSFTAAIPGSADLFYRRFLMGVQLAGIFAAGVAVHAIGSGVLVLVGGGRDRSEPEQAAARASVRRELISRPGPKLAIVAAGLVSLGAYLSPAFKQTMSIASSDASFISSQHNADTAERREIAPIISIVKREGGRVYAGLPVVSSQVGGWGSSFTVGQIPVFKYLAWENVDEVGFTLRTASLMTDPEVYFDEDVPADYPLFGVRWLLYPLGKPPVVAATRVAEYGPYVLWRLPTSGYLQVVDTVSSLRANRSDIGRVTANFIRSRQAGFLRYLSIAFAGRPAPAPTSAGPMTSGSPGRILSSSVSLASSGGAEATVEANRRSVVLLKASYDPGWRVTVDGRREKTEMIAPAYVGVVVSRGRHHVVFTYERWPVEGPLLLLAGVGLLVLVLVHVRNRRRSAASVSART